MSDYFILPELYLVQLYLYTITVSHMRIMRVSRVAQLVEPQIVNRYHLRPYAVCTTPIQAQQLCYKVHLHRKDVGLLPVLISLAMKYVA